MDWNTACLDWEDRILTGRTIVPDLPLFEDEASRALRIFKRLRIPDVIGTPTMLEACGEWVFPIVEALFGSYDPVANIRMIQEFFLLVPKKNSKSSSGGAIMVVALIVNRRPNAEFLLIAPTKEIADIAFKQAAGTIRIDAELSKLFHIQRHLRLITHRNTGATLQIKAADTDVITGSKATGTMIDETHVFAKKANAADIFLEIRGALTARTDGFLFQTTTQSKAPPAGVFKTELGTARDVRDGTVQLPLLPVLYELPTRISDKDGWKDRTYWHCVNPNMGRSVNEEFLAREVMKAEGDPAQTALIASQHFNVEIGLSLRSDRWPGADFWEEATDSTLSLPSLITRSDVAVIGIDGGGLDDLFGLTVLGREIGTKRWLSWSWASAHRIVLNRRKSEAARLKDFEADGDLTFVGQMADKVFAPELNADDPEGFALPVDIGMILDLVKQVDDAGILHSVGLDPFGVGAIVDALAEAGIGSENDKLAHKGRMRVIGISQGWKLSGAIKTAERKLSDGTLVHADQALMAWCVGNARIEPRGNAITITKQASGTGKIDPLMALFNAVSLMSANPEAQTSVYEERGMVIL